ncbi:hypothetical protein ACM66Z_07150 [Sulfurovum sp. ST-21]|uniref:Uncharacterized protein n=1 Tax=Sulfurovum indicum TaxID=2779528 RepID=A0A7M1S3D0_9BACT|nr:hypothetical protein [Sulfurovum indicum]QOR61229.1 hypothetical protein IMZ28_07145 [Sulfurovum indicum]
MKTVVWLILICSLVLADNSNSVTTIREHGTKFMISNALLKKHALLVKMILATESMDDDERQYWFDILPSMTDRQTERLYNILETERRKLQELEKKYAKEIRILNEKHLIEYQKLQYEEKIKFLNSLHSKEEKSTLEEAEELLQSI